MALIRKIICTLSAFSLLCTAMPVFANSMSHVNDNLDDRRRMLSEPALKVYTEGTQLQYVYYGAKFEPRAGAYIGTPYNRKFPGIENSMNTLYDWFVPKDELKNDVVARREQSAKESDHTVLTGYNWNFSLKGGKEIDIAEYSNYLYNEIDQIDARGEDVILVFGKEMNIDSNFIDPELFKRCFRFVADYVHTKTNIAMCWAPNDTGGLDTTLDEYYPGDEYVDWIGCSMYTMPYFQGNPENDDGANMAFIMGKYANPSMRAKVMHEFMARNNVHKPVFITEGGVGFESPDGTDYTEWAKKQLRLYYSDLVRAYPEFKCIISFNNFVYPGDLYHYDMGNSPELLGLLQELTQDSVYIKSYGQPADKSYIELSEKKDFAGVIPLSAYAYVPEKQDLVVRYLIDGNWAAERSDPPYAVNLTSNDITYGNHELTCEVFDGSSIANTVSYNINFLPEEDNYEYTDEADNGKCTFVDMAEKPAEMKNSVATLNAAKIINGVDETNFAPTRKISRYEFAALVARFMETDKENAPDCELTDVASDDVYYKYVCAVKNAGYMSGYDDNTFRGNNTVTRNEIVSIMSRMLQGKKRTDTGDELTYDDVVEGWVYNDVRILRKEGIMLERRDNLFCGTSTMDRGEVAVMMGRLYKKVK